MDDKAYYYLGNTCYIVGEIKGTDQVVIEIEEEYEDEHYGSSCVTHTVVVSRKYVNEKLFSAKEEFLEIERERKKMQEELRQERHNMHSELYSKKRELEREINKLEKDIKDFKPLEDLFKIVNEDYKYFVYLDSQYGRYAGIHTFEEAVCRGNSDEYAAVQLTFYRSLEQQSRRGKFGLHVSQYSDYSGSHQEIKAFKTLPEAIKYYEEAVELGAFKLNEDVLAKCKAYMISSDKITQFEKQLNEQKEKNLQEKREKLTRELEGVSGCKACYKNT